MLIEAGENLLLAAFVTALHFIDIVPCLSQSISKKYSIITIVFYGALNTDTT